MTDMVEDVVQLVCSRSEHQDRRMKFWEVYVDEGNLSQFLNKKDDVEARIFSLPDWNFEDRGTQLRFLDLMDQERPLHVMVAFECRLWSPMQNMNYRTAERKQQLAEMRALEEKTHPEHQILITINKLLRVLISKKINIFQLISQKKYQYLETKVFIQKSISKFKKINININKKINIKINVRTNTQSIIPTSRSAWVQLQHLVFLVE